MAKTGRPKKATEPRQEPETPVGAATEPLTHQHVWRVSYGPDNAPTTVCSCGARRGV